MQYTKALLKWKRVPSTRNPTHAKNDQVQFKEFIPIKSTNYISSDHSTHSGESCTKELQALFECLKKWEFDNLPCSDLNNAFMDCVGRLQKVRKESTEKAKNPVHENRAIETSPLSAVQINDLMSRHPQPQLGKYPYKAMKRLPNQSYADDIFHRKNKEGKPN